MNVNETAILEKIKKYAIQIIQFKNNMDFIEFSNDEKTIAACMLNLSQIGELTGRLDKNFINSHNHIPWNKIIGMRHRIVHDYEGLQMNIIWDIKENFLPELILSIDALK